MHSRNTDMDVEKRCMDTKVESGGMNWEIGTGIYTLLILQIKYITTENLLFGTRNYSVLCDDLNRKETQERTDMCTCRRFTFPYSRQ